MKTIEILGPGGIIAVRECDLKSYKSRGFTMCDGKEIKIAAPKDEKPATEKFKKKPAKPDKPEE